MESRLDHWADILVLFLYFAVVLALGLWTMKRPNRGNVQSYFLAGRSMKWFVVGASIFATNIGSEHFMGLVGAAASTGIAMILFEWLAIYLLILCGWCFVPVFISAGVYTIPEYIEKRFGSKRIRNYFVTMTLIFAIVLKLAGNMFAGSLFIQLATGWDMYLSVTVLLIITAIYTVLGGLTAVMYTDTLQTVIMMIGSFILAGICYNRVGGWTELKVQYMAAIPNVLQNNTSCGLPSEDAFSLYHDPVNGDIPWTGLLAMTTLGSLFYWCGDQVIVQRYLAASTLQGAKAGAVLASVLKILPMFVMIVPGLVSRVLFTDDVVCVDPDECMRICDNPTGCTNIAYPKLVLELLPTGMKGFLMAVIMSAIMSSLTSIFNSSSTVFTLDLWMQLRPLANQRELLIVGRVFVVFMCVASILWLPLIKGSQGGKLYNYVNMVNSCLMEPMSSAFVLSVFWKRTTENGVFYGLLISHAVGVVRLVFEFMFPFPPCGMPETRPAFLYRVHFMNFGAILILFSGIVIIILSLLTTPRTEEQLENVTYWTRMKFPPSKMEEHEMSVRPEENKPDEDQSKVPVDLQNHQDDETTSSMCQDRLLSCLLGTSDKEHNIMEITFEQKRAFLTENIKWSKWVSASALVTMGTMFFLLGYFR
ncbi:sodium/mannose cotransporter SLC5A10-like [Ylistrum balloti]|uniref:sodium/mannose cotransporter SLC5A10-like n=1 Tax=Ylistrum balloti TaxID=509963 RepID=UPI00290581B8|nr:sodium/mannose cotransporter SLC5A10-like [Ylistrum balloti]